MSKRLAIITVSFLAFSFLVASFLILLDQKLRIGVWFQVDQVLHHETFAIFFFVLAVGVILGLVVYAVLDYVSLRV
jgi:hypothetical protein